MYNLRKDELNEKGQINQCIYFSRSDVFDV